MLLILSFTLHFGICNTQGKQVIVEKKNENRRSRLRAVNKISIQQYPRETDPVQGSKRFEIVSGKLLYNGIPEGIGFLFMIAIGSR